MSEEIERTMAAIARGEYPEEPIVDVAPPFKNASGHIWNVAWGGFESASYIISRAGSSRSHHYHRSDSHFIYVTRGLMLYYFLASFPRDDGDRVARRVCRPGALVFTPPMVVHSTYFPVETEMFTLNGRKRDGLSHEEDVVRVAPLVRPSEICPAVLNGNRCILPFEDWTKDDLHPIHGGFHLGADGKEFAF